MAFVNLKITVFELFWFLSLFRVLFLDLKYILKKKQFSTASLGQIDKPISLFHFVANDFQEFENNCFRKKKFKLILPFSCFLFYLLPILTNETPLYHKLVFAEGSIEHIFGGQKWLFGCDSVFSQVSIEYFVVTICCSFCNKKIINDRS